MMRELFGEEEPDDGNLTHVLHLEAGLAFVRKAMTEIEETMAGNSSDDANDSEEIVAEEIVDDDDKE